MRTQLKIVADAWAQVINAQINGPEFAEPQQALNGRLIHMASAYGGHAGQAAHSVKSCADHAAMDPIETVVAHQVGFHIDAGAYFVGL